ncbi:hypothetical protein H0H87_006734 [Tephrocybe sp. NHM501043]|nr:hypothetical protein H0H87_006734 [Tephrocybe sp. NHM501043]
MRAATQFWFHIDNAFVPRDLRSFHCCSYTLILCLPFSTAHVDSLEVDGSLTRRLLDFTFNIGLNGGQSILGGISGTIHRRPGSDGSKELQDVDIPADKLDSILQAFSYVTALDTTNGEVICVLVFAIVIDTDVGNQTVHVNGGVVARSLDRRLLDFTFNIGLNGNLSIFGGISGTGIHLRHPGLDGSKELQHVDIPADKLDAILQAFFYIASLAQ